MKRQSILVVAMFFSITVLAICESAFADLWTITQLTDNDTGDFRPSISGTNVVWENSGDIYSNFAGQIK